MAAGRGFDEPTSALADEFAVRRAGVHEVSTDVEEPAALA